MKNTSNICILRHYLSNFVPDVMPVPKPVQARFPHAWARINPPHPNLGDHAATPARPARSTTLAFMLTFRDHNFGLSDPVDHGVLRRMTDFLLSI